MLDHEEKFLFKEEILHLATAVAEPGTLDNVEDLLTDVITSPRFDSEVFTLERSLQVMLGPRAGTTPDGIQGHNFATQIAHIEDRRVLQGRLTLVRYNNEPQFFLADAGVFYGLIADLLERLGPHTDPDTIDQETLTRLREALTLGA